MTSSASYERLSDQDLIAEVKRLAQVERGATAALVASLAEMDARRLYLGQGCSSLFSYCTQVLHLSEHAAYGRIEAARIARRFPAVLQLLERGEITLTTLALLGPQLTPDNHLALLDSARHKSKREVEQIVAALAPKADAAIIIRRLPVKDAPMPSAAAPVIPVSADGTLTLSQPASGSDVTEVPRPVPVRETPSVTVVKPIAPERFRIQLTVSRATHDKLRRAQDLMRHRVPNGDVAQVIDRALTLLVEHLEKTKLGAGRRSRTAPALSSASRQIPSEVKRAVWRRDEGRCAFIGAEGRCAERGFLEFHHVVPYALGGATTVENLELRCRGHNQHEAREAGIAVAHNGA